MSMLEKLITEIQTGQTQELHALANRLHTSPQMIQAMLDHLERHGLLHSVTGSSTQTCQSCSLSDQCGTPTTGAKRLWVWRGRTS